MEVMEEGNLMDRVPILLQRDLEYYQKNHTVLSETVCPGIVGGRLDFPRNASFASVKLVMWWEEEFYAAFRSGSGLFCSSNNEEDEASGCGGIVKASDPDKFVTMTVKSADFLLDHLHILAQEALDHADLPVLTATLGAAALVKNSLHCYIQMSQHSGSYDRNALLQSSYKRYGAMTEAVAERLLDLHVRLLSLYLLQDAGGRPIDDQSQNVAEAGSPSVQGWWLYMQGTRQDLWETVPPKMAQRIFAGMLNETLTILTVRYCQTNSNEKTTILLINDILNVLLCTARLLPSVCTNGNDLAGLDTKSQTRDVRDIHAKCSELFKCMVFRGAPLHLIHKAFKHNKDEVTKKPKSKSTSWFAFASPHLFPATSASSECSPEGLNELSPSSAVALELLVLLAQPQPCWSSLVKVLMMRKCHLACMLLKHGITNLPADNLEWPASGLWLSMSGSETCGGFLCTADGFCKPRQGASDKDEIARAVAALTYIIVSIGSMDDIRNGLLSSLEGSTKEWASCLDRRQIWCRRRPPWLAALLALASPLLPPVALTLVNAVQTGASMYQAMSLCLTCFSRLWDCFPSTLLVATNILSEGLPTNITPTGGSVLLQILATALYEELQIVASAAALSETRDSTEQNGKAAKDLKSNLVKSKNSKSKAKTVSMSGLNEKNISYSQSISFDGSINSVSSVALAVGESLCSIDEDNKHTEQIQQFIKQANTPFKISETFGLDDFPQFSGYLEEGKVSASCAERESDAGAFTGQLLMTQAGKDSLRVVYGHLAVYAEMMFQELGIFENSKETNASCLFKYSSLLYIMFHIGERPFDQYLRNEWTMPWSHLVELAGEARGARPHILRRTDVAAGPAAYPVGSQRDALNELLNVFKTSASPKII